MASRGRREIPDGPGKFFAWAGDRLIAYAEHSFRVGKSVGGKSSVADHLAAASRQAGRRISLYKRPDPELPPAMAFVWGCFLELHSARTSNGYSYNPISFGEIAAWSALARIRLGYWETGALRRLDATFLRIAAEKAKPEG